MVTSFSDVRDSAERKEDDSNHRHICAACHREGGVIGDSSHVDAADDCSSNHLITPALDFKFKSSSPPPPCVHGGGLFRS